MSIPDVISIKSVVTIDIKNLSGHIPCEDVHDFWEIAYVKENSFAVLVDGELFELEAGECIIYNPLSLHIGACEQNTVLQIISFESDSQVLSLMAGKPIRNAPDISDMFDEIIALGAKSLTYPRNEADVGGLVWRDTAPRSALQIIKKKIELMLIYLYSEHIDKAPYAKRGYKRIYSEQLTDYLKMNINKTLTLSDMADELSISVSRLKAISKEILGASPIDYFITLKMEAAVKLICDGGLNFTQISERLGFSSVHYFSKLFKKRLGMSPSEYTRSISLE